MMNRYQRMIVWLISLIPSLVMIVMGGGFVVRQANAVLNDVNWVLVSELQNQFGREVSVGRTTIRPFGTAVLEDVQIAAEKKLYQGKMLSIPRICIKYNLDSIFNGRGAGSVSRITVYQPTANIVRRKDGSINILDLVKKKTGPSGPPFTGEVEIQGANVLFTDYRAKTPQTPAITKISDLTGKVIASGQPVYQFSGTTKGADGRLNRAWIAGQYDGTRRTLDIDITGDGVDSAYWSSYFGIARFLKISQGVVNGSIGLHFDLTGKSGLSVGGVFKVSDAVVQLPMFNKPVKRVYGSVAVMSENVLVNCTGDIEGTKTHVTGSVNGFSSSKLDLVAESTSADYNGIMRSLKLPKSARMLRLNGAGPLKAGITGPTSDPVISVSGSVPGASILGYKAQNIRLAGVYRRDGIEFRSVNCNIMGGKVALEGTASLGKTQELSIRGCARKITLAKLPLPNNIKTSGVGNASFSIQGLLSKPQVVADASASDINVAGFKVNKVNARIKYDGKDFHVTRLRAVGGPAGSVALAGQLSTKSLQIYVKTDGADLGQLTGLLGLDGLKGTGYIRGWVKGTLSKPRFAGDAELFEGSFKEYPIDYARVSLSGDTSGVRISQAIARMYPAELKLSGQIGRLTAERIPFQLDGDVDRLTIKKLTDLLGRQIDLTGTISGSVDASGIYVKQAVTGKSHFIQLEANSSLKLEHATAYGLPVSEAQAQVGYLNDKLKVSNARLTSDEAVLDVSGQVALSTNELNFKANVAGLNLARIRDKIKDYAIVGGVMKADGTVTGTISNPSLSVQASVSGLSVNGRAFELAKIEGNYVDGNVASFNAELGRGKQSMTFSAANFNPRSNHLDSASGELKNVSLVDMRDILVESPYAASPRAAGLQKVLANVPRINSGDVNASFEVSGSLEKPSGNISLKAADVGLDIRKIESIQLEATAVDGLVTLKKAAAESQQAILTLKGSYSIPEGNVNLEVDASNFDLSTLSAWIGSKAPGGIMSVYADVKGSIDAPSIIASVDVLKPSYAGVVFDAFRLGKLDVKKDSIEISDVFLASGSHQAVASGKLPWSWDEFKIPTDKPIALTASIKEQSLSLIHSFTGGLFDKARTQGTIEGSLDVAGKISDPQLTGKFKVQNGTLAVRNFSNEFSNLNIDLGFDGNRITVNQLSADSSLGGNISVIPGGYITLGEIKSSKVDLQLAANGLIMGEKNLLGMKEDILTRLDAGIALTGSLAAPVIADRDIEKELTSKTRVKIPGGVTISSSKFVFAAPEGESKPMNLKFPVNPRFDVSLRVGTNVWIAPPSMAMRVLGSGSLSGELSAMKLAADLKIAEGTLKLASSRLRVNSGGEIKFVFAPPSPLDLGVDFKASTSTMAKDQFDKPQRYRIDIAVSGTVADLKVNLESTPSGLSNEKMLAALGKVEGLLQADTQAQLQKEIGSVLTAVGSSTLLAPIETLFADKLGFEQFSVDYNPERPLSLYVSKPLFNNVYLTYFRRLTSRLTGTNEDTSYEVSLGYRFSDRYSFIFRVDDKPSTALNAQYTIQF